MSMRKRPLRSISKCLALFATLTIASALLFAAPAYAVGGGGDSGNPVMDFFGGVIDGAAQLFGLDGGVETYATTDNRTADLSTKDEMTLGEDTSTRYDGRVWIDKSVSTEDVTFDGIDKTVENDSDFLVTYSALANSTQVNGESNVPVDTVFVVDVSGSMLDDMNNGQTRIEALIDALNASMDSLMEMNEQNRIAVVVYSEQATVMLPLDHYTKMSQQGEFFSVDSEENRIAFSAINSEGRQVQRQQSVNGGTNIHMGVDTGMDVLREETDTTVTIGSTEVSRVPSLVLLTDGSPTYSGADTSGRWGTYVSWWDPSGTEGTGFAASQDWYSQGDAAYEKFAMKTIMNAAYNKQQVDEHYGVAGTQSAMKVYTVGLGLDQLGNTDRNTANLTLNPTDYLSANNTISNAVETQWNNYLSNRTARLDEYTFQHPENGDISSIAYNDGYYTAENAEDVTKVFEDIVSAISVSIPKVPTQVSGNDPMHDGYITYTDTTGKYMEVKDVKTLIWSNTVFNNKAVSGEDTSTTTYTFSGEIDSPVYGKHDASEIIITVTDNGDDTQTIKVQIPASAIPLRVNTVKFDANGDFASIESDGAMPLRLVYSVGLEEGIDANTLAGVDDEYINANTVEGKVNFYSNAYSAAVNEGEVESIGAQVTFTPAATNPFYYFQEETPIYTDSNGQHQAQAIDENTTYYIPVTYYAGNDETTVYIERAGSTFADGSFAEGEGGIYAKANTPRIGNIQALTANKDNNNATGTASTYRKPTWDGSQFVVYLGNNGRMRLDAPASLVIAKNVNAGEGLTAPDATFTFQVTSDAKTGQKVNAVKTMPGVGGAQATTENTEVVFNEDGIATVELKAGESIELKNMSGADYSITETALPGGFSVSNVTGADSVDTVSDAKVASGTVNAGSDDETVTFTNTYTVTPVTSTDLHINLGGTKAITGRDFQPDDSFTFTIAAAQATPNAPLPQKDGADVTSVTITPTSGSTADFTFDGEITFTKPGEYRYIVAENEGNLAGVNYDATLFRINIVIVDNGNGTMRLATVDEISGLTADNGMATDGLIYTSNPMVQKYDGTLTPAEDNIVRFENTYSSTATSATIQGVKNLNVENSSYSLKDGDFTFTISALGSTNEVKSSYSAEDFTSDPTQPMPVDQNGGELTSVDNIANGNVNFTFGGDAFTQDMVGRTFGYRITESLADAPDTVTMDANTDRIVWVTVDDDGAGHVTTTVGSNEGTQEKRNNFTFTNSYTPTSTTIGGESGVTGITVQKTFKGHEWTSDYSFVFDITNVAAPSGVNVPMPAATELTIDNPKSGDKNSAAFGEMTFDQEGTYTYEISEKTVDDNGIAYDTHRATVTVTVTENKATGTLSPQVSYDNSKATTEADKSTVDAAAFTNTYSASFDQNTAVNLSGTKRLTVGGNSPRSLAAGAFFFVVAPQDGAPTGDNSLGAGQGTYMVSNAADDTADDGVFSGSIDGLLKNITYSLSDMSGAASKDFVYLISEQQGSNPTVTYDSTVYQVTVTVTDDGKGTLSADKPDIVKGSMVDGSFVADEDQTGVSGVVFNNSYTPAPSDAVATTTLTKVLSGNREPGLQADEFEFTIEVSSGDVAGVTLPANTTIGNAADGTIQFGSITFTKVGIYKIKVTEVVPEDAVENPDGTYTLDHITYDTHSVESTFTVTDNNGKLNVSRTGTTGSTVFTNSYVPDEVTTGDGEDGTSILVTKQVIGAPATEAFTFSLNLVDPEDVQNVYEGTGDSKTAFDGMEVTTSANMAAGAEETLAFKNVTFTAAGDYSFVIDETTTTTAAGWTYDGGTKQITVHVADQDGTLVITGIDGEVPTFTNSYEAAPVSTDGEGAIGNLQVNKKVVGVSTDTAFSFTVTLTEGNAANVLTKANDPSSIFPEEGITKTTVGTIDDGQSEIVDFGNLTFTAEGTYTFQVDENGEAPNNWTYDSSIKTITIHVTDKNYDGQLDATYDESNGNKPTFINVYYDPTSAKDVVTADDAAISIDGKLVGVGDTITYTIDWANNDPTQEAANVTVNDMVPEGVTVSNVSEGGKLSDDGASITWTFEDVAYGTTGTVSFTAKVNASVAGDAVENNATVSVGNNTYTTNTVTNPVPGKSETSKPEKIGAGTVLTYEITFVNTDGDNATASVVDKLTKGQEYNAGSAMVDGRNIEPMVEGDAATGQTLTWSLENLQANAKVTLTFNVTITRDAGISVDNTATVNGHNTNTTTTPYPSDDKKDVFEASDLATSVDGKLVGVGDTLTYVIDWAADVDGNVTIRDTLPTGTELVEGTITESGDYDSVTRTITWNLGQKAAGDKGSVKFNATVTDEAISVDNTKNTATIQVGENDPKVTNEVSVVVPEKSVENNNDHADGEVQVGDSLTYTIEVPNTTDAEVTMTITDAVPDGVTVDEETIDQDGVYNADNNTITWTVTVASGDTGCVNFTGVVNESAINHEIDNQATVEIGDNEYKTNTVPGEVMSGNMTISKTVELTPDQGTQIDTTKLFEFTLDMKNVGQENLTNQYAITGAYDEGGNAITEVTNGSKIYLHHGDAASITGLPSGATVTATEIAADGYTPRDGAVKNANIQAGQTAAVQFVNVYGASEANEVPAGFKLTKEFKDHAWTDAYSFQFAMTGVDADGNQAPLPVADEAAGVTVEGGTAYKTVTGPQTSGTADFDFGAIRYTKAGTYTYTVREVIPADTEKNPGIEYSNNEARVVVRVTDLNQSGSATGKLVATATVDGSATFTNTYKTGEINYDATAGLQIVKSMTGRAIGEGDFTFTMTGVDDGSIARLNDGEPLEFSTKGAALGTGADANHATEIIEAKTDLVFTQDDAGKTYTYEVKEVNDGRPGVTYDETTHKVKFVVTDDGNGTLSVETFVDEVSQGKVQGSVATKAAPVQLAFQNSYDAGQVTVGANGAAQITGTKTLANDDISGYNFKFSVKSGNVLVTTGSNNGTGTITFDDIVYTTENLNMAASDAGSDKVGKADRTTENGVDTYTFNYTVSEDTPSDGSGVTANSGAQQVTVVVTDSGTGELSAMVAYDQGDLKFENTYGGSANYTLTITGNKKIEGAQGLNVPTITDGMFGFDIVGNPAEDNTPAPMPEITHVENEGSAVSFGPITYTMENVFGNSGTPVSKDSSDGGIMAHTAKRTKVFTYTITESANKTVPGVTNDASAKNVEVTVYDWGDGTLTAEVTSVKTEDATDFTFINKYSVEPETSSLTGDGGFTITKELNSNTGRQLADGEFTFQLTNRETGEVKSATNTADGSVSFEGISFSAPGTYKYTLSEVKGDAAGMNYSSKSYNVTAQVSDNGDGTLSVTWSIDNVDAGGTVEFVNEYEADPASIVFGAIKTLDGREMQEGEFTFQLTDQDGNVLETTNRADGSVVFPTVNYDKPGTYTYTVTEKLPEDDDASTEGIQKDGVTYDETEWTATVNVSDNTETGCLEATVDYGNGEKLAEFHNTYVEPPAPTEPGEPAETIPATGDAALLAVAATAGIGSVLAVAGYVTSKKRGE